MPEALQPDVYYHIYNRANGSEKLFLQDEHYRYFLKRYKELVVPVVHSLAYCLMPNHFHFLVRIKSQEKIEKLMVLKAEKSKNSKTLRGYETLAELERQERISRFISQQWAHFFNGYTQAFNKDQNRMGSLFMRNYKRKVVKDEDYLRKLIHYVHYNPVKAGLTSDLEAWKFSSYKTILSGSPTILEREEVISFFDDIENFRYCHNMPPKISGIG